MRFHGDWCGAETVLNQRNGRLALVLSLVVHLIILFSPALEKPTIKPESKLEVYLKPLVDEQAVVRAEDISDASVPESTKPAEVSRVRKHSDPSLDRPSERPKLASAQTALSVPLRQKLAQQVQAFYPDEYVQQGIEGDVVLRLFIAPETGAVIAIRVETPSQYALFNEAARQAALSSFSALTVGSAPEVILPVRFRLRN